jgi:hypothetical protein
LDDERWPPSGLRAKNEAASSCVGLTESSKKGSSDSTPPARTPRSKQTGQNAFSLVAENFAPQAAQIRIPCCFKLGFLPGSSQESWASPFTVSPSFSCDQSFAKLVSFSVHIGGV